MSFPHYFGTQQTERIGENGAARTKFRMELLIVIGREALPHAGMSGIKKGISERFPCREFGLVFVWREVN